MLAGEKVAAAFTPGAHASTFGGTPLVTAVALKVLKILEHEGLVDRAAQMGDYLTGRLNGLKEAHCVVKEVRGKGLLVGVQLSVPGASIVKACMDKGFLINCIQDNVLRLAPPLVISRGEIDALAGCLDEVLTCAHP
jgi:acetylornithine/succinyldiaminopimelate/putrescine aminotransferase